MKLFLQTKWFLCKEQLRVMRRFYPRFFLVDFLLGCLYFFSNPFRMCRKIAGNVYGETPLSSWEAIAKLAKIESKDLFLDLGCGRGRLCFWMHRMIGCRTIGIDGVASFISRANRLKKGLQLQGMEFFTSSITQAPLERATVIYLYTFHPDEEKIAFSKVKKGTRVITVSEPLEGFQLLAQEKIQFPWGQTDVYINGKPDRTSRLG